MVYAYDKWALLPVKDLYDSLIMLASINAAKDMYEKADALMKEFNKTYGDFFSPIQKDMDWYNKNVTGAARDMINNLYDRGIDPLRSAEGRAMISRFVNNMPVGEINKMKLSAEDAKEYLKNRAILQSKGLWNPDFERLILGGRSLDDWSTNDDGLWTRTAPAEYQDLNQYTSHIFDALKDSYIGTDKDHYDLYGVTAQHLMNSLTPDTLGGLVNSDLGRFHYNNARNDLIRQGVENPTEELVMDQFRKNIVSANNEKIHVDRKLNDMWKLQLENNAKLLAARIAHSGSGGRDSMNTPQYSFMEFLRRNTAAKAAGKDVRDWGKDGSSILSVQRDAQIETGKRISKITGGYSGSSKGIDEFIKHYSQVEYSPDALVQFLIGSNYTYVDGKPVPKWNIVSNNTIRIPIEDADRLFHKSDITSHTTGFRGPSRNTNRDNFKKYGAKYIDVTFDGPVYGAFMKRGRNENYFHVRDIVLQKENIITVPSGKTFVSDEQQITLTPIPVKRGNEFWFDSHITSNQGDPRAGYLGTVDKAGKIKDTPNIKITNTHDYKYMDAVQGDMFMSEKDTQGTAYDFSATLPEILGFGQLIDTESKK